MKRNRPLFILVTIFLVLLISCNLLRAPELKVVSTPNIELSVENIPDYIKRGEKGKFVIKTLPRATCWGGIGYYDDSIKWTTVELEKTMANDTGICHWDWLVPRDANPGIAEFRAAVMKNDEHRNLGPQSFCIEVCP